MTTPTTRHTKPEWLRDSAFGGNPQAAQRAHGDFRTLANRLLDATFTAAA